jgi:hypothetical protein
MSSRFAVWAMIAFIIATIVVGLFGPWLISLFLAVLCAGCWWASRRGTSARDAGADVQRS